MKKYIVMIVIAFLILANTTQVNAATTLTKNETENYLDQISIYDIKHVKNPSYGSVGGEWTAMGLARYGTITEKFKNTYKGNIEKQLKSCKGVLSERKYTEYSRVAIALTSIGENPTSFVGYNILKPLSRFDNIIKQGINGVAYALIAFDSGNYDIPKPDKEYDNKKTTRDGLVGVLLSSQLEDGGWSIMGDSSDTDLTAMVLQALAPYKKEDKVKKTIDKALARLSKLQQKDGGYATGTVKNCESTAQVLTAISELGISVNDSRFVKDGKNVLDGLLKYYSGGAFKHLPDGDVNQMATDQGFYALAAYYRNISGKNRLFEMKDGIEKRELEVIEDEESLDEKTAGKTTATKNIKKSSKKTKAKSTKKSKKGTQTKITAPQQETIIVTKENGETSVVITETTKASKKKKLINNEETLTSGGEMLSQNTEETTLVDNIDKIPKNKNNNVTIFIVGAGIAVILAAVGTVVYMRRKSKSNQGL